MKKGKPIIKINKNKKSVSDPINTVHMVKKGHPKSVLYNLCRNTKITRLLLTLSNLEEVIQYLECFCFNLDIKSAAG